MENIAYIPYDYISLKIVDSEGIKTITFESKYTLGKGMLLVA
jgi:hypothetical protein